MRISNELEQLLGEIKCDDSENYFSLSEFLTAYEKTTNIINSYLPLKEEKDFYYLDEENKVIFKKSRYDSIEGLTIYSATNFDEKKLFDIEISSNGDVDYKITGSDVAIIQDLIDKLHTNSSRSIEYLKLNADISFFTENREIIISKEPYLAIKMGKYAEGNEPVLIYRTESKDNNLNLQNSATKYIRINQCLNYLKNLKINERLVPSLVYAYLGEERNPEFYNTIVNCDYNMNQKYGEKELKKYRSKAYSVGTKLIPILGLPIVLAGSTYAGSLIAADLSNFVVLSGIIAGASSIPIIATAKSRSKKKKFAENKDKITAELKLEAYQAIKKYSNSKIKKYEKRFIDERKAEEERKINENLTAREIADRIKKSLTMDIDIYKNKVLTIGLTHIINAYKCMDNISEEEKEKLFYDEILDFSTRISDTNMNTYNSFDYVLGIIERLGHNLPAAITINHIDCLYDRLHNTSSSTEESYVPYVASVYLKTLIEGAYEEKGLAVEVINGIRTPNTILRRLRGFAERIYELEDVKKSDAAEEMIGELDSTKSNAIQIYNLINIIKDNNLVYDLLGNESKQKVKRKENKNG